MCLHNLDAKIGLGFALYRQEQLGSADSLFAIVARADSGNADAWDGLTLTRWRRGDRSGALFAGRRALKLNPRSQGTAEILRRIDPDWDRPAPKPPIRPRTLRVDARTRGEFFEVPGEGSWSRFYVQGVNLGVALPGRFPTEFPQDSAVYAGWLETIASMNANTLRVYTILPPAFYRALRGWNITNPYRALWLVHGVWTELPPGHNFDNRPWKAGFREEMRRVVNLIHGNAAFPARPGHAGGRYETDVSRWTLGYIIGREWEPFAVKAYNARFETPTASFQGNYFSLPKGLHIDAWMVEQCDYLMGFEASAYNTIRPVAYTNWPTLDPLHHVTEATTGEEMIWRRRVGRVTPQDPSEYENDAISVDAMLVRPTARNPAGWFASYHIYPYYPDFMLYDPVYDTTHSSEGRSNYFGYLRELKRHHAGVPLLVSEYGVPSSRGDAHWQPQGWNHGGHDETAMAAIDARLTREIRESGAAGAIVFAWLDEWFKRNWMVMDYEIPQENTRQWHNVMDAEQYYGILGLYAGDEATTPRPGGDPARWLTLPPLLSAPRPTPGQPARLRVGSDESFVYLTIEFPEFRGRDFPWPDREILVAFDTYRRELGQRTLPDGILRGDLGFEFVARFRDTTDAELRIIPDYSPYFGGDAIINGDDYGRFARRPISTVADDDGRFDSMFAITNRARFTRNGGFIPTRGLNRGVLRYGPASRTTLSDWYWDRQSGMLELRLPWNLLNVSDPSTGTLLYETNEGPEIGTAHSDGFRIGVVVAGRGRGSGGSGRAGVIGALPATARDGRWHQEDFPTWTWPTWTTPHYHERLKPVYDSLKAVWGGPR